MWSHIQPERLGKRVAAALTDERNRLWFSPIGIWEFLLLAERGRLRIRSGAAPAEWIQTVLERAGGAGCR